MEKKFSIILPIYNVEKYLNKCLDSIVNQNYDMNNVQVILVDDGSTDNSTYIAKEYENNYDFIEYHLKPRDENSGLGNARNFGMKYIKGEFFICIDSDDYIDLNTLAIFDRNLKENKDTNLLIFDYERVYESPTLFDRIYKPNSSNISSYGKLSPISSVRVSHCAWNKLFRTEKYKDLVFINTLYEDIPLNKILFEEDKILVINDVLYFYLIRSNSLMTQGFNINKVTQNIENFKKIAPSIRAENINEFNCRFVKYGYIFSIFTLIKNNKDKKLIKKYVKEMNSLINKLNWSYFSMFEKTFILCVRIYANIF